MRISTAAHRLTPVALVVLAHLLLLAPEPLAGQLPAIRFDRLSLEEGLSQSTVTAIVQDDVGFMWLGTQQGLNRFDGHAFHVYRHDPEDPASLPHDHVTELFAGDGGELWIGTDGGGLARWDGRTGSFTRYRHDPKDPASLSCNRIRGLRQDRRGVLWAGTMDKGLNRFDPETATFTHFRHDPADPASLASDQVRALYEDRSGNLWIGTLEGLHRYDPQSDTFERFRHDSTDRASLGDDRVRSIFEDRGGNLWVGTLGGLYRFEPTSRGFARFVHDPADPASLSHDVVRALFEDDDGRLWIGTDGGLDLLRRRSGTFAHYRHRPADSASLSDSRVMSIFQDSGGVLWVGTINAGVNKWNPVAWSFGHYKSDSSNSSSLSSDVVFALAEDRDERLWIGTFGGGLNVFDRATAMVAQYRHDPDDPTSLSDDRVSAVLHDRSGTTWVGTLMSGLNRLHERDGTFTRFRHDPTRSRSLSADTVSCLYEDSGGGLWVGTYGGGLNRWDPETETFDRFRFDPENPSSLGNDRVTCLLEKDGGLWIGTIGGGLDRLDGLRLVPSGGMRGDKEGTFTHYPPRPSDPQSLPSEDVLSLHVDPSGVLWIGTRRGLAKLVAIDAASGEARFKSYSEKDGLPDDIVSGVHSDARGNLWLSTNNGLSKFDPKAETFTNYDVTDGLQSNEFNFGAHHQSPSGELFFGGVGGFNAFFPERIERNAAAPPVVLTSLKKLNQPVDLGRPAWEVDDISLSYRDALFAFEFAALDYTAPEKNRYRYQLEGLEGLSDTWVSLDTERRVSLSHLEPGSYTLRVQGSNSAGVWSETGATIRLVVPPPLWRTWWAYTLYAVAVVAAAWSFAASLQRKVERERARVRERERLLADRERLIDELEAKNTELERFNYTIAHDLRNPLVTIKGFIGFVQKDVARGDHARFEQDLSRISGAADKMSQLLDELLELARLGHAVSEPQELVLAELVDEVIELVDGRITMGEVKVEVAPDLPLVVGDRMRLMQVYQNLIDNAVRYMGSQRSPLIEVGVRRDGETPVLFVRDNGMGIEAQYHEKVFGLFERLSADDESTGVGLALVKRIVAMHGGRIWVESQGPGFGSTFCFTLRDGAVKEKPVDEEAKGEEELANVVSAEHLFRRSSKAG